jgi:hypothetical protein
MMTVAMKVILLEAVRCLMIKQLNLSFPLVMFSHFDLTNERSNFPNSKMNISLVVVLSKALKFSLKLCSRRVLVLE